MTGWKFAVRDVEDFKKRGLMSYYAILTNGRNSYTGEMEADYIKQGFTVMTEAEFDKIVAEYEDSICGHWMEISEQFYNDQMNILPPMRYYNGGFYISEADTGNIHGFYQEYNGKYYTSLQRTSTNRNDIVHGLIEAIKNNEVKDRTDG